MGAEFYDVEGSDEAGRHVRSVVGTDEEACKILSGMACGEISKITVVNGDGKVKVDHVITKRRRQDA